MVDIVDCATHVQTDIGRDLIVSGTSRMQTLSGIPDQIGQTAFNIHMNVFERNLPVETVIGDFLRNLFQAAHDIGKILRTDNLLCT